LSTAPRIKQQKNEAVGSALTFKEDLFNLKRSLEEKARVIAIPFPEEYGLQEYETQLPRDEDLPQLFFYIDLVKYFMTLLIELPVEKIEYLRFTDVTTQAFATHDAERYSSFTTEIAFSGSYIALLRFLSGIQNAPEIHTINSINIVQSAKKDAAEGDLEITVSISTFSIMNN
jgi:Tfp pilus assembly protein PilO